jgi:Z1 domain
MKEPLNDRGKNITYLQGSLLKMMEGPDASRVVARAKQLVLNLPDPQETHQSKQGLMLGLIQSGKTVALTTSIALSADNGYKCFIVLTTDNIWLYEQTIERLKADLQGLEIEGKDQWYYMLFMVSNLGSDGDGLALVSTKNAIMLSNLVETLDKLKSSCGGRLPATLIIDDEADQASLDTKASRRARNPDVERGTINDLIMQIRSQFDCHTYLQVTATPQALFLQDINHWFRPEFTILIEPGTGYIGGNTFFSLEQGRAEELIRYVSQDELDDMLDSDEPETPASLKRAMCTFYIGAAIKYLQNKDRKDISPSDLVYSFICHISQRMGDHAKAEDAIRAYYWHLKEGVSHSGSEAAEDVEKELRYAYSDLSRTVSASNLPSYDDILCFLHDFIVGTDIQVLNSGNNELNRPRYNRRFNILIGGNKLARGVTINNLLVTYYGRQARSANMDTMLQHARMYGYREKDLDVTRLFVTRDVEERFQLINQSEEALRDVIQKYPSEKYRGILIGRRLNATRRNILNPNNIGAYAAGSYYFPKKPMAHPWDINKSTEQIDKILDERYPRPREKDGGNAIQITIEQAIELIKLTKADIGGSGLWNRNLIITALEELKKKPEYREEAYLVVRRDRELQPNKDGELRAVLGGSTKARPGGDISLANRRFPTLFMYRLTGKGWNDVPFWVPLVRFPDGQYALMFNFD